MEKSQGREEVRTSTFGEEPGQRRLELKAEKEVTPRAKGTDRNPVPWA